MYLIDTVRKVIPQGNDTDKMECSRRIPNPAVYAIPLNMNSIYDRSAINSTVASGWFMTKPR